MTDKYEHFYELLRYRISVRTFKRDPIPDGHIEKILEAARWAMSGANSQPWEFIVVKDPETKNKLADAYREINHVYEYWTEMQRAEDLRHPAYQIAAQMGKDKDLEFLQKRVNWDQAPALIVVLGDPRKQWGTVMVGHTPGKAGTYLTDGLSNTSQIIQLTAASLGLGSEWVSIHLQDPFKRILNVPDHLVLFIIIPIGYPAVERRPGYRREIQSIVHYDKYDKSKFVSDEDFIKELRKLRKETIMKYQTSYIKLKDTETQE